MRASMLAACLACMTCISNGVATAKPPLGAPANSAILAQALDATVADSTTGWNEGDLPRFMALYSTSPDASFAGSKGITRGRPAMMEVYRKAYDFTDLAKRGRLSIERLDVRPLGPGHALYIGRFTLTYADGREPATGLTSLVFAHEKGGWKVIADHSS